MQGPPPLPTRGNTAASPARPYTDPATDAVSYQKALDRLKRVYAKQIRPLEVAYRFEHFNPTMPPLNDMDLDARPMVLLLGQYSTGKTTFIRHLLGRSYPGEHIGMEPTTDRFVAVMGGEEERVTPGHAAAVSKQLPFTGLQRFGSAFLSRFQVSELPASQVYPLQHITFIDTPGVLAGEKQRVDRGYDFPAVIGWFAEHVDLILLLFDGHKLDVSDEFRNVVYALRGHEDKVRVVLNKCDQVSAQQLMRVYGALMWSLGKVVATPEVMRVYLSSFRAPNNEGEYSARGAAYLDQLELLEAERMDLLQDLADLPRYAAVRKVNGLVKRARKAKVHAVIIGHLKKAMPAMFGRKKQQAALLENLTSEFMKIQATYAVPAGDFPRADGMREKLKDFKFSEFKKLSTGMVGDVDQALAEELPTILQMFPNQTKVALDPFQVFPLAPRPLCPLPAAANGSLSHSASSYDMKRPSPQRFASHQSFRRDKPHDQDSDSDDSAFTRDMSFTRPSTSAAAGSGGGGGLNMRRGDERVLSPPPLYYN